MKVQPCTLALVCARSEWAPNSKSSDLFGKAYQSGFCCFSETKIATSLLVRLFTVCMFAAQYSLRITCHEALMLQAGRSMTGCECATSNRWMQGQKTLTEAKTHFAGKTPSYLVPELQERRAYHRYLPRRR